MSTVSEYNSSSEEQQHTKKIKSEDTNDSDTAKIISNELLLVGVYSGVEKMDELTSLEREIAEMHNVEPSTNVKYEGRDPCNEFIKQGLSRSNTPGQNSKYPTSLILNSINHAEGATFVQCNATDEVNNSPEEIESTALDHEDLIAVLKGIDDHSNIFHVKEVKDADEDQQCIRPTSVTESELVEGVTIEGEGQFQIMEVVYDELDEHESIPKESQDVPNIQTSSSITVPNHAGSTKSLLTHEEIRAVAMEQIAGLNARVGDRQRRRKQDIKPLQVEESSDLVTALGADWSDDDTELEYQSSTGVGMPKKSNFNIDLKNKKREIDKDTGKQGLERKEVINKTKDADPNVSNVAKLDKVCSDIIRVGDTNVVIESHSNINTTIKPVVGFKRTRIIKPKIIWDPDAPETQISYAQLARNSSKINLDTDNQSPKISSQRTSVVSALKGMRLEGSKIQQAELKEKKSTAGVSSSLRQKDSENKQLRGPELKIGSGCNIPEPKKAMLESPTDVQSNRPKPIENENVMKGQSPVKRRSQTPVTNGNGGSAGSKKKRVSEIDRLVSDEGAANMLHSLESERSKLIAEQGADKPHKPLMRSRAATISERVSKRETTPTSGKTTPVLTSSGGARNKRNSKQKPSSTWDYVYKQQASEDAMIIRRRSNSSYSSNASVRRLSLDAPISKSSNAPKTIVKSAQQKPIPATATNVTPSSSGTKTAQRSLLKTSNEYNANIKSSGSSNSAKASPVNSFEFAKPELKSNQKNNRRPKGGINVEESLISDSKKATVTSGARRGSRSPATIDEKDKIKSTGVSNKVSTKQPKEDASAACNASDVVVKKVAKVAQIVFNTQKAKINYTFTSQMLNKLVDILEKLSKDPECNAVLITTNAPNFCFGVDFTDLTVGSVERRKQTAVNLAMAVKNYLKTLATFPKPLIAGVNGINIGLGVMQLPLFDIVIGSDKGSYETPYVKIGQVPEGYCIWNNITKVRDNYKTKLFWLGEKLHSTESALSGLVHKLTASAKVNDDALLTAKKIAIMSTQSYQFMKKTIINNHLETINKALDEEFETIIQQWTSSECYESFKKYLESGQF